MAAPVFKIPIVPNGVATGVANLTGFLGKVYLKSYSQTLAGFGVYLF